MTPEPQRGTIAARLVVAAAIAMVVVAAVLTWLLSDSTQLKGSTTGVAVTALLAAWSTRLSRTDAGLPRQRDGWVVLPRRWQRGVILAATAAAACAASWFTAAADREVGPNHSYRGDAEVLILAAPPFALLAVALLVGAALGRGRVELSPAALRYVPLVTRSQQVAWDQVTFVGLREADTALVASGPAGRVKVPLAGQRWTGATLLRVVQGYADAGDDARARLTDPRELERWLNENPSTPRKSDRSG